jgi:PAS domain S-box-containing protein
MAKVAVGEALKQRRHDRPSAGRLRFEALISELSAEFTALSADDVDSAIEQALGRISESLRIEQVRVLEFADDKTKLRVAHCWENQDMGQPAASFVATELPWSMRRVVSGKAVCANRINELPRSAADDKKACARLRVKSVAILPLEVGRWILGAMSFATVKTERVWSEELVSRLKLVSQIFANALKRKRIVGALRNSEERFRVMSDTAPVMLWVSGPDKKCTHFNKRWLDFTGRSLNDELGDGWACSVHPEDLQHCLETYESAFDALRSFRMEYRLRRFDGQYRWVVDSGAPNFGQDGSFAGFIGSCIDINDSKDAEEAVRKLTGRLINAQEDERRHIARELHDDINQSLALLAIEIEQVAATIPSFVNGVGESVCRLSKRAVAISQHVQAISHQLHSSQLELLGLDLAVRNCCEEYTRRRNVKVEYKQNGLPADIPADVSLCVFRVFQEALRNAVKHSGTDHMQVYLGGDSNEVHLSVRDRGRGFNLQSALSKGGLGLISMQERLHLVDGRISIRSYPKHGTEIDVWVPIRKTAGATAQSAVAA